MHYTVADNDITYLALGKQQLDATATLDVSDRVVVALLVVTHGVEARGW